jgi:hypothetical protein
VLAGCTSWLAPKSFPVDTAPPVYPEGDPEISAPPYSDSLTVEAVGAPLGPGRILRGLSVAVSLDSALELPGGGPPFDRNDEPASTFEFKGFPIEASYPYERVYGSAPAALEDGRYEAYLIVYGAFLDADGADGLSPGDEVLGISDRLADDTTVAMVMETAPYNADEDGIMLGMHHVDTRVPRGLWEEGGHPTHRVTCDLYARDTVALPLALAAGQWLALPAGDTSLAVDRAEDGGGPVVTVDPEDVLLETIPAGVGLDPAAEQGLQWVLVSPVVFDDTDGDGRRSEDETLLGAPTLGGQPVAVAWIAKQHSWVGAMALRRSGLRSGWQVLVQEDGGWRQLAEDERWGLP